MGCLLSAYYPTLAIDVERIPVNLEPYYRGRVQEFYTVRALIITCAGPAWWTMFRDKPSHQISSSSAIQRSKSWDALKLMGSRPSVLLLLLHLATPVSVATAYAFVMSEAFKK